MAAYLVARGEHLPRRGIEVYTHETQVCSVSLLKPIHDGRGLRSRHSVVRVEEDERWTLDCRGRCHRLAASAGAQSHQEDAEQSHRSKKYDGRGHIASLLTDA